MGPIMAHGYGSPAYGPSTRPGDPNASPYGILPWTAGQSYHPFFYYHPVCFFRCEVRSYVAHSSGAQAQHAYPHPSSPRGSHSYEGSSDQQPATHSPSTDNVPGGIQTPTPTDDPPRGRKRKRTVRHPRPTLKFPLHANNRLYI